MLEPSGQTDNLNKGYAAYEPAVSELPINRWTEQWAGLSSTENGISKEAMNKSVGRTVFLFFQMLLPSNFGCCVFFRVTGCCITYLNN